MDAAWLESERDHFSSQREKRWSMNSQRLEEIVAELMKPISSDARRSFDTDLSALLEEYLTEAGLHALDAADEDDAASAADAVAPNFAEIALLLQQSANIYGRKVDFLYNHVLAVSDSLGSAQEAASASTEEPQTPTASRRRRRASLAAGEFAPIALEASAASARDADVAPPPQLARAYLELEPRAAAAADVPLLDYGAEDIGLLADFQVTWRLQDGLLVDELEGGAPTDARSLRPISLLELQAAIELAEERAPAAWSPAGGACSPAGPAPPLAASTPLPGAGPEPPDPPPPPGPEGPAPGEAPPPPPGAPPARAPRKRPSDTSLQDLFEGDVKILFDKDLMKKLKEMQEFSIDKRWISKVVQQRKARILSERTRLADELRGEAGDGPADAPPQDGGFAGWTAAEARSALLAATRLEDSDADDGFFELSSGGGSELSEAGEAGAPGELAAWRSSVLQRAAAAEARGSLDAHALGSRLLAALPPAGALALGALLLGALRDADVAHVFLAVLFLANAGNVEIVQGPPLSLNSFALRLLSSDESRFRLAAQAEAARAGPPAGPRLPLALEAVQRRPKARPHR